MLSELHHLVRPRVIIHPSSALVTPLSASKRPRMPPFPSPGISRLPAAVPP